MQNSFRYLKPLLLKTNTMKKGLLKSSCLGSLFIGSIFSLTAKAQIVYTDIKDITYTCNKKCGNCYVYDCSKTYALDLNKDGTADFNINTGREVRNYGGGDGESYCCLNPFSSWVSIGAINDNSVLAPPGSAVMAGSDISSVSTWSTGVLDNFKLRSVSRSCQFDYSGQCGIIQSEGDWPNSTDRYLGLKIILNGHTHYGWARLSVVVDNSKASFKIMDYAYESSPDRAIIAGDKGESVVAKPPTPSSSKEQPGSGKLLISPNPVSSSATISFSLPGSEKISVKIFDLSGKMIKTLADGKMDKGIHQLTWNAENAIAGIYILRLQTSSSIQTRKLVVIK